MVETWLQVFFIITTTIIIIIIIIITMIYKNENPMVCLLALWVYIFFSERPAIILCIKDGFFYSIVDKKSLFSLLWTQ